MKLIPWRVSNFFNTHFHSLYMLLKFKTTNLNTSKHWDCRFANGGYQESENTMNVFHEMERLIPNGASVCDVGTGSGYFLKRLFKNKTSDVYGLDISQVAIDNLKQCGIDGCRCELPMRPPINRTFDFITAKALLEHLKYPDESIEILVDMLNKSGKLLIAVPNNRLGPEVEPEHFRKYTKKALFDLLSKFTKIVEIKIIDNCLLAICEKRL
ncbi:class I SAM-dependent methyltransferase [Candidatus Parcubacteria bacterium]|nr:class I SAM-dependent methyltransferase [Candidatus Parcubacteria bacterium]